MYHTASIRTQGVLGMAQTAFRTQRILFFTTRVKRTPMLRTTCMSKRKRMFCILGLQRARLVDNEFLCMFGWFCLSFPSVRPNDRPGRGPLPHITFE